MPILLSCITDCNKNLIYQQSILTHSNYSYYSAYSGISTLTVYFYVKLIVRGVSLICYSAVCARQI